MYHKRRRTAPQKQTHFLTFQNFEIMKKLIQFSIFFLLFSFSYSCTKNQDEDFSFVEGFVVEYNSKKPIPNARIIIQNCGGEFLSSFSCSNIDTIYSDAKGYYSYRKDLIGDEVYSGAASNFLVPSKKNYFPYTLEDYAMPTRGNRKKDMVLTPEAWLRVHVKPINKYGNFDLFELRGLYAGDSGGFSSINKIGEYYTPYYKQAGNDSTTIYWTINKEGGIETKFEKKVYLTSTDSTTFELLF
jgi:hypothetical protein